MVIAPFLLEAANLQPMMEHIQLKMAFIKKTK
jgi:hypothetical protein